MTESLTTQEAPPPEPSPNIPKPSTATRLPSLRWTQMRLLGNIQFLKVSYLVLVGVPLLAVVQHLFAAQWPAMKEMPLILRLTYFSSLLLSCAHMVYQGFCPQIIKRFDSPNDLYRDLLQIKSLQANYLPDDKAFSFDMDHCRNGFERSSLNFWFARLLCCVFYITGIALFAAVIALQSLRVIGMFI
jgi:hypothetical protein